ncbi:cupin domain-containing protein [Candidatus Woesearchaeota archaeon]|nr:cupin domain-containing protein [Candidatus Woesearchaeota archaeon]
MQIQVKKPTDEERKDMESCGVWEKEVSEFPWEYDEKETCLLIEGKVEVTEDSGEKAFFGKGDLVVFPKGLKCTWKILEPVKKYYRFG